MPDAELPLHLAGENLLILAGRALFWPDAATLFVADVHFGKDATFRQALRWVPPGTTTDDLARLSVLLARYAVRRLVILGDVFHSEHAQEPATYEEIRAWRSTISTEILMVRGNHDRRADAMAEKLQFTMCEEGLTMGPWILSHHPRKADAGYVLCGHLHPVAKMRGAARQSLRVPCFWATESQCVLPAFGGFTGGGLVRPGPCDKVILVAGNAVIDASACSA